MPRIVASPDPTICKGCRRKLTETLSSNSYFYDALTKEGASTLSRGHDHMDDFCPLRHIIHKRTTADHARPVVAIAAGAASTDPARTMIRDSTDDYGFGSSIQTLVLGHVECSLNTVQSELMSSCWWTEGRELSSRRTGRRHGAYSF